MMMCLILWIPLAWLAGTIDMLAIGAGGVTTTVAMADCVDPCPSCVVKVAV